eukprot:Gb_01079 [translate_table: standard]
MIYNCQALPPCEARLPGFVAAGAGTNFQEISLAMDGEMKMLDVRPTLIGTNPGSNYALTLLGGKSVLQLIGKKWNELCALQLTARGTVQRAFAASIIDQQTHRSLGWRLDTSFCAATENALAFDGRRDVTTAVGALAYGLALSISHTTLHFVRLEGRYCIMCHLSYLSYYSEQALPGVVLPLQVAQDGKLGLEEWRRYFKIEVGNVPYVVDNGAGVFCKSPKEIANIVAQWFGPKAEELEAMSRNALKLAQPDAVFKIVHDLDDLIRQRDSIPHYLCSFP